MSEASRLDESELPALVVFFPGYKTQVKYQSEQGLSQLTSLERILLWAETIQVKVEQRVVSHYLQKDDL